jgi:chromosomal replication initiation ATPase DnaA
MTKEEFVAKEINRALCVDVYAKIKNQDTVDARSLYCYILRNDLGMKLYDIRDSIVNKGRKYNHATVLYAEKMYNEVVKRKPHFEYIRENILIVLNPRHSLIKRINELDDEKIKEVEKCINNNL